MILTATWWSPPLSFGTPRYMAIMVVLTGGLSSISGNGDKVLEAGRLSIIVGLKKPLLLRWGHALCKEVGIWWLRKLCYGNASGMISQRVVPFGWQSHIIMARRLGRCREYCWSSVRWRIWPVSRAEILSSRVVPSDSWPATKFALSKCAALTSAQRTTVSLGVVKNLENIIPLPLNY